MGDANTMAKRANAAAGAVPASEAGKAEIQDNELEKRFRRPAELDAAMLDGLVEQQADDPALTAAQSAHKAAAQAVEQFRAAAPAAVRDETEMPLAREWRVNNLAAKTYERVARNLTEAHRSVYADLKAIDEELATGYAARDLTEQARQREFREALKACRKKAERQDFINRLVEAGDRQGIGALTREPVLAGLSESEARDVRLKFLQKHHPQELKRRESLQSALDRIERATEAAHRYFDRVVDKPSVRKYQRTRQKTDEALASFGG